MNLNHIIVKKEIIKDSISFNFTSVLDLNKNLFIKPFGSSRMRYETANILNIKLNLLKKTDNLNYYNISISKNYQQLKKSRNAKFFWSNNFNIILEVWSPIYYDINTQINNQIIKTLLPNNYGEIIYNNVQYKYNSDYSNKKNKIGIVVPIYSRHKYVEKFLCSLKKTNLDNCLIVLIDESLTKDVNNDHKKVNKLVNEFNIDYPLIKIFKNKHGNMFDSILYGMDLLYSYCDYLCTIDSDTIHKNDWIKNIHNSYCKCSKDYPDTKILASGFNMVSKRHSIIEKRDNYIIKSSVGGCNMFFSKDIYTNIVRRCLFSHKWDTNIVNSISNFKCKIITTNPSVVQHIGFQTSINGRVDKDKYDYAEDFY